MNKKSIFFIFILIVLFVYLFIIRRSPTPEKEKSVKGKEVSLEAKSARQIFNLAKTHEANNELLLSKVAYQNILDNYPNYSRIQEVQRRIEELNMKIILSPTLITTTSQYYEVRPGDSLSKIARKFNTTIELIKRINMLKSDVIRPRMRLKMWTGKFSLLIDKSQNILMLKSDGEIIKTYTVSTGRNNSTPVGTFKVVNKLIDPVWFRRGVGAIVPSTSPENILGSRWMGFDIEGYGIHGTVDPKSLGQQVTEGCVRMKNKDAEELYLLLPVGTEVTIID